MLNKKRNASGRIWGRYYAVALEKEFVIHRVYGYIIGNLLKHNEVKSFDELTRSPFSNFKQAVKKYGLEGAVGFVTDVINLDMTDIADMR